MLIGYRKFIAYIIAMVVYAIIIITRPEVDLFGLGLGITGILTSFGGTNVGSHFADSKKTEKKE